MMGREIPLSAIQCPRCSAKTLGQFALNTVELQRYQIYRDPKSGWEGEDQGEYQVTHDWIENSDLLKCKSCDFYEDRNIGDLLEAQDSEESDPQFILDEMYEKSEPGSRKRAQARKRARMVIQKLSKGESP